MDYTKYDTIDNITIGDIELTVEEADLFNRDDKDNLTYIKMITNKGRLMVNATKYKDGYSVTNVGWMESNAKLDDIKSIIVDDTELRELYLNDPYFRRSIDAAVKNKMSIQDTLICALKIGYSNKNKIQADYENYIIKYGNGGMI